VESSPRNYHDYWLVNDCPLEDFKPAQKNLAATYDADKSVNDLPSVMRLPGFPHQKAGSEKGLNGIPFMVQMIKRTAHLGPDQWAFRKEKIDQRTRLRWPLHRRRWPYQSALPRPYSPPQPK